METKDGEFKKYHENGQLKISGFMKKGKYHGLIKEYIKDGSIFTITNYKFGIMDGIHEMYHENGQLEIKGTMKDDKPNGYNEYYDSMDNYDKNHIIKMVNLMGYSNFLITMEVSSLESFIKMVLIYIILKNMLKNTLRRKLIEIIQNLKTKVKEILILNIGVKL